MRIAIIGGGITGLTTALALKQGGLPSTVYEQSVSLNAIGAGIWLQPNAIKILERLDLREAITRAGVELREVYLTDHMLRPFKVTSAEVIRDAEGRSSVAIHRARLHDILYNAVSTQVRLNHTYQGHHLGEHGITIQFEQGQGVNSDIMLGADGIHSKVRASIFPDASLRHTGQICWRGISSWELPDKYMHTGIEAWGRHARFGFSPIFRGEVYWFAVTRHRRASRESGPALKEHLMSLFQSFSPVVREIIGRTDFDHVHCDELSDLARLSTWHKGPVCLLGDAAHATTPNMGQGACQGIEDACCLSHLLSGEGKAQDAFRKFEAARREKVDYIVRNSRRIGWLAHAAGGRLLMRALMAVTPESVLKKRMHKLYDVRQCHGTAERI